MITLRQYLAQLIPALAMLISLHIYSYINKLTTKYTHSVNQQYSIVVVASQKLNINNIKNNIDNIHSLTLIPIEHSLKQFKEILSDKKFDTLSRKIPNFYQLKLFSFPTNNELANIKNTLLQSHNIIKVETFIKKHSSFNIMLENTKIIVNIFTFIVVLLSSILIIKITEAWYFEHQNRMDVMELFGASLFQRSRILFEIVILNSILSTAIVVSIFYYIYNGESSMHILASIGLSSIEFDIIKEVITSLSASLGVYFIILFFMLIKHR